LSEPVSIHFSSGSLTALNTLKLSYYFSKLLNNGEAVNRTVAVETGIQNSGLALILIFNFFDGNTAMAVVAAWLGVWHLISGFAFSAVMHKRPIIESVQS
jgi:bile acid:Na+ symporter, BASS family